MQLFNQTKNPPNSPDIVLSMLLISRNCIRAGAARHLASVRLLSDARLTSERFDSAGTMGDNAAASLHEFMKGAEGAATSAGGRWVPLTQLGHSADWIEIETNKLL
jgi:hypothetical protein